jgi:hypothetical protein
VRSDLRCPPVSTVEVCRPTSTVDVQRCCAYFRAQQSETWENLLLLELTPGDTAADLSVRGHVAWPKWGGRDGTSQQDDDGRTGLAPRSCSLGGGNSPVLVAFKNVLNGAGLPERRLHDLRHTYATDVYAADVHPRSVQELLGHSRLDMTNDLYAGSVPEALREAVERLDRARARHAR